MNTQKQKKIKKDVARLLSILLVVVSLSFPQKNIYASYLGESLSGENENLTEDEKFLVSLFQGNIKLSRTDLESKSGLGKAKIIRTINSLIEKNIIARSGKGRSTKYYIL